MLVFEDVFSTGIPAERGKFITRLYSAFRDVISPFPCFSTRGRPPFGGQGSGRRAGGGGRESLKGERLPPFLSLPPTPHLSLAVRPRHSPDKKVGIWRKVEVSTLLKIESSIALCTAGFYFVTVTVPLVHPTDIGQKRELG